MAKHSAHIRPIDVAAFDAEAYNATRKHVDHGHDRIAAQSDGFNAKEVNTAQAVLRLSDEGQARTRA